MVPAPPTAARSCVGLALLALAAACSDPVAVTVPPEIRVATVDGGALQGLSFGRVPTGQAAEASFMVQSLRPVPLEVRGIEIEDRDGLSSGAFSVETPLPFAVEGSGSREVVIRFSPGEERSYDATLVLSSSDPERPQLRISMTGEGVVGALSLTACLPSDASDRDRCERTRVEAPEALVAGEVIAGQVQPILVTLSNLGFDALQVESIGFSDEEAALDLGFQLPQEVRGGVEVQARANQVFEFRLTPPVGAEGPAAATLVVLSSDPERPTLELPVEAEVIGNRPPLACLAVAQIRSPGGRTEWEEGQPVVAGPTDELVFESQVRADCTGDPEGGPVITEWTLEGPDAFARLEDEFGAPTRKVFRAQRIGEFEVSLTATDELGLSASTDENGVPARLSFEVKPNQDIAVEVSWEGSEDVDLDLHLVRGDEDQLFDGANDCYGLNPNPAWGTNQPLSNPRLAWDDQGTKGLFETALLDFPEPERRYSIFVHAFRDSRSMRAAAPTCFTDVDCDPERACSLGRCMPRVTVTARVFVRGEEMFQAQSQLNEPCQTWEVGTITWPAAGDPGQPLVQPTSRSFVTGTVPANATQCVQ